MNYERFFTYAERGVFCIVAALALFVGAWRFRNPPPPPSFYILAREAARERLSPWRLSRMVTPSDLRIERVNDTSTNVWGWLECTNTAGLVKTQWFRCVFFKPYLRQHYVKDLQYFKSDPAAPAFDPSVTNPIPIR